MLSLFMGWLGCDRYYLGKIGTGILKTITLGGLGIWWFIDVLLILYNKQTDIDGNPLDGQERREPLMLIYCSVFYGFLGFDRFYLNQTGLGVVKAITFGGLGVWYLIDIYLALKHKLAKEGKDEAGRPLQEGERKYQTVALLFSITAGTFAFDRFYLGHRSLGMIKLFTLGAAGLWTVLDIILLILNSLKDAQGNTLIQE
jgi:TM2 domain-containing membrane protein YozV